MLCWPLAELPAALKIDVSACQGLSQAKAGLVALRVCVEARHNAMSVCQSTPGSPSRPF